MRRAALALGVVLLAGLLCPPGRPDEPALSARERAVRQAVEQFFAAYGRKDLDAMFACWHSQAPGLAQRKKALAETLAQTGPLTIKGLRFRSVKVRGGVARVEVRFTIEGNDKKTGKRHASFGTLNRGLELVRAGGAWKVRRYDPPGFYYAGLLLGEDDPDERRRLWPEERAWGRVVCESLSVRVYALTRDGQPGEALKLAGRALELADHIDSDAERGWCLLCRGLALEALGKAAEALKDHDAALGCFRRLNLQEGVAVALARRGRGLLGAGKPAQALKDFEESKRLADELAFTAARGAIHDVARLHLEWADEVAKCEAELRRGYTSGRWQPAAALRTLEAGLKALTRMYGAVHPEVADWQADAATLHAEMGELDRAARMFDLALAGCVRLQGKQSDQAAELRLRRAWLERLRRLSAEQRGRYWQAEYGRRRAMGLHAQKKYVEAQRLVEAALPVVRELLGPDHWEVARALSDLGRCLSGQKKYEAAVAQLRASRALLARLLGAGCSQVDKVLLRLAYVLEDWADDQLESGDYGGAAATLRELIGLREKRPDGGKEFTETLALVRWRLAHAERAAALPPDGQRRVKEAQAVLARLNRVGAWEATDAARRRALAQALLARQTLRELLGEDDLATVNYGVVVAALHNALREPKASEDLLVGMLGRMAKAGVEKDRLYARTCFAGVAQVGSGDTERAGPLLREAVARLRAAYGPSHPWTADGLRLLAHWYRLLGETPRAFELYLEAGFIYQRSLLGERARGLGRRFLRLDRPEYASLSGGDLRSYAEVSRYLAEMYAVKREQRQVAESLSDMSSRLILKLLGPDHSEYAKFLLAQAYVLSCFGDLARAEPLLERAEAVARRAKALTAETESDLLRLRARLQREKGDAVAAEALLRRWLSRERKRYGLNHRRTRWALSHLAVLLGVQGRRQEALGLVKECLESEQRGLGRLFETAAEEEMQAYLQEEVGGIDPLASLVAAEPTPANVELLWTWVLRRKGALLDSSCRFRAGQFALAADPTLARDVRRLQELRRRRGQLALYPPPGSTAEKLRRDLEELDDEAARLQARLQQRLARHRPEDLPAFDGLSLADVRRKLPPGTVLVEFLRCYPLDFKASLKRTTWAAPHYLALAMAAGDKGVPRLVDLGEAKAIEARLQAVRERIAKYPQQRRSAGEGFLEEPYRADAAELYAALFGKLRESLAGAKTLLLVPDGRLHLTPFAALVDGDKYLIEKYRIACLSSGRDLLRPRPAKQGQGTVVFAGPDFDLSAQKRLAALGAEQGKQPPGEVLATRGLAGRGTRAGWRPLPGAAAEAGTLKELLGKTSLGPVTGYVGGDALEERLKAVRSPRVLHLATHGFFFPYHKDDRPASLAERLRGAADPLLRSGVVLAGANAWRQPPPRGRRLEDGWMLAAEIALLDLRGTDLVVLSACESGLGDVRAGEGVFGLRRAFLYAGARTVVSSLFEVDDAATLALMRGFYGRLAKGAGKLEALHAAQVAALEGRRKANKGAAHPFYWAGFTLTGDTGP